MQTALNVTTLWCNGEGLKINPSKTKIVPFTKRRKVSFSKMLLEGIELSFSSEVKYLGVTLDSKLLWNTHLQQVIMKATNAFWISKRTFGMKWGLRPKMLYWIYSAIVKPRITYASLIWWPKTMQRTALQRLDKLQRIAIASITGAMRSSPSKALEALLNMLPLHQYIKLDAMKSALRIRRMKDLFEGDLKNHLSILKEIHLSPLIINNEDFMPKVHEFNHQFNVIQTTRDDWSTGGLFIRPGSIVFYTDGSKQDDQVGAGITGPGINCSVAMGRWSTVFQAEIYAILHCVEICLKRKYKNANICIFSDSQAALNALKSMVYTSKIVWECYNKLQQLSLRNRVNLYWVPGHCGIEGNEKADELAKLGSSQQFIGPEPFIGLSTANLKLELKNWEESKVNSIWNELSTARQSKRFIKPNASKTQRLLNLSKKDLCTYTGLITGHCPSKYHQKIIKKLSDERCRFCNLESETSEHLLCDCVALFNKRRKFFDKGLIEPREIWNSPPIKVVNFIRCVIPNWDNTETNDEGHLINSG